MKKRLKDAKDIALTLCLAINPLFCPFVVEWSNTGGWSWVEFFTIYTYITLFWAGTALFITLVVNPILGK